LLGYNDHKRNPDNFDGTPRFRYEDFNDEIGDRVTLILVVSGDEIKRGLSFCNNKIEEPMLMARINLGAFKTIFPNCVSLPPEPLPPAA
jgi:hypothetical protein